MSTLPQTDNIDPWVRSLPAKHLQLSASGRPSRPTQKASTIGDLLDAVRARALQHSSPTAAARIKRTIDVLLRALATHPGAEGWDHFRKSRPAFRSFQAIYFASSRLRLLSSTAKSAPLGQMQFTRRAINSLHRSRIKSIGVLVTRAEKGLINLRGIGESNAAEIVHKLDALASSTQSAGSVDWIGFARRCGFKILPQHAGIVAPAKFITAFPDICDAAVASTLSKHTLLVLRERLLCSADQRVSRPTTAAKLRENRETIRQDEAEIIDMLGRAIWNEDFTGCHFRFRREFLVPLFVLKKSAEAGLSWERALAAAWQATREDLGRQECLLVRLVGRDAAWARSESTGRRNARELIRRFVKQFGARRFTAEDMSRRVRERLGRRAPAIAEICCILERLPDVRRINKHALFEVAFDGLNVTERCERLLREHRAPMHIHELTMRARGLAEPDRRVCQMVASLLHDSRRFLAIGKSGYWSLSEWTGVETRTIADVAAEVLRTSRRPMHARELVALIRARRPLKTNDASNLAHDKRFVRVRPATWTLRTMTEKGAGRN